MRQFLRFTIRLGLWFAALALAALAGNVIAHRHPDNLMLLAWCMVGAIGCLTMSRDF